MKPTRRDFLELAARAAALPAASEFLSAWAQTARVHHDASTQAPPEPPLLRDYRPRFFDAEDFAALQAFTEILIPTDDTPGAREAHCAHFIDFVLDSAADVPAMQKQWRDALAALRSAGFHAANAATRESLVAAMSLPERDRAARHPAYAAYRLIKQETVFAFYTSRAGLIEALDYRGNSTNAKFPPCEHPEHQTV